MRLETERLLLRDWRDEDAVPYAAIIADPEVRRYFPNLGTLADAEAAIATARERLKAHGMAFQALERKADGRLLGTLGMSPVRDPVAALVPGRAAVEIGWQLGKEFWGEGYAPEGARACLAFGWDVLQLPEIIAITYRGNLPSRRVMEKLGMHHDPAFDFEHPGVPEDHKVRPHVLYRIAKPA